MRIESRYLQLVSVMEAHGNPQRAAQMKAYMRDQFDFLGIPAGERRRLLRSVFKGQWPSERESVLELVTQCWDSKYREMQYCAMDFMARRLRLLGIETLDFMLDLIQQKSWWDTVDWIASNGIGLACIDDRLELRSRAKEWIQADNMWIRRTAILFQLKYKENTDQELLFELIRHTEDSDLFFVRKAHGWALREYSKTNPQAVRDFLQSGIQLSGLAVREASKYL